MRTKDFEITIQIDKKTIDLNRVRIGHVQLHSYASNFMYPIGRVSLIDTSGYFDSDFKLGDGLTFTITINHFDYNIIQPFKMRIFRFKAIPSGKTAKQFDFILNYNAPRWIIENTSESYKGSSSSVIQKLAEESGLLYEGDVTNDSMTWLGSGQRRCVFARKIEKHGHVDTRSCTKMCLDLNGTLYYKNMYQVFKTQATTSFISDATYVPGRPEGGAVLPIEGFKEITKTGLNNALTGYGYETLEQGVNGDKKYGSVQLESESSLISAPINKGIGGSRVKVAPLNSGNTHNFYEDAMHRNKRLWNLMTNLSVQALIKYPSRLPLLRPVNFVAKEIENNEVTQQGKLNGRYVTTMKTIFISPAMEYYEKFELSKPGYSQQSTNAKQAAR